MSAAVHVIPVGDTITHVVSDDCVCGPTLQPVAKGDVGSIGWVTVHHSLDARELSE